VSASVARGVPREIAAPALQCWLDLVRGQNAAVDIGANIGIWSVMAAAEMPAGASVLAVEPAPASYDVLVDCARVAEGPARIIPVQCALGDRDGTAWLALDSPMAATNRLSNASGPQGVEVRLLTLDALLDAYHMVPAVIKVDVEGAELVVLRGAARTLCEARPTVVLELHWGRDLGAAPETILGIADEHGYTLNDGAGTVLADAEAVRARNFVIMLPK
jgi:FkbM family methyltransferase